jgi:hypothetical protein
MLSPFGASQGSARSKGVRVMRTILFPTSAVIWICALFSPAAFGASCALPDELQREVSARYPESHVVSLSDLGTDDRATFVKEHGDACPGLSVVDFYGDGKTTYAIDLVTRTERARKALLVVAREVDHHWTVSRIDTADSSTPVVWNDKPGEYPDVYGKKKIHATRPVIVWCAYDAWSILYAWTGTKVSKIWLSD